MDKQSGELFGIREACRVLNVHPDTLRRWEKDGKIASVRIGPRKDRRYKKESIYRLAGIDKPNTDFQGSFTKSERHSNLTKHLKNSEAVIFDLSDTLMEPHPSRGEVFARLAYKEGYNLNPRLIEKNSFSLYDNWEKDKLISDVSIKAPESNREYSYTNLNADALILSGFPKDKRADAERLGHKIYNEITSNPDNWRVIPGTIKFIELLIKTGKKIAILDNWNHHLPEFIKGTELSKYFPTVVTAGVVGIRKPDPKIFNYTLEKLNVTPEKSIYIGNRYVDDYIGPKSAGITPIFYDSERKYIEDKSMLKFYYYEELMY